MESDTSSLPVEPTEKNTRLLSQAKLVGGLQVFALFIAGIVFLPLLFSHDKEAAGWGLLLLFPFILLAIIIFFILSILGAVVSTRLVRQNLAGSPLTLLFIGSILCSSAFLFGFATVIVPIVKNHHYVATEQKARATEEQKRQEFFHDRYAALSKEFEQPQIGYDYQNGMLTFGTMQSGELVPDRSRPIILLGPTTAQGTSAFPVQAELVKGKSLSIVLPDEQTFQQSYSCDGPYQDCIFGYPQRMPSMESFFAYVYAGDRLLNEDFTEEEQLLAKNGREVLFYQAVLSNMYDSYVVRFQSPQKVVSVNVSDKVYLQIENTNKIYPEGKGIDSEIFGKPVTMTLDTPGITPAQQKKIEDYLATTVVGRNVRIVPPGFGQVQQMNSNFNNSDQRLSIQMKVTAYLSGETRSLNTTLLEL